MLKTVWGVAEHGKVSLLEDINLPDGASVLVTIMQGDDDQAFLYGVSQHAFAAIWDNSEDDVYAKLLEE